jgi:hypothetical protein
VISESLCTERRNLLYLVNVNQTSLAFKKYAISCGISCRLILLFSYSGLVVSLNSIYTPAKNVWGGLFLAGNQDYHRDLLMPDFEGDQANSKWPTQKN